MKILVFNQDWFVRDFKAAGHEVMTCGFASNLDCKITVPLMHIDNVLKLLPQDFKPDRLLFLDNSSPVMIAGLEDCQIPAVFYSVDTHHHASLHKYLSFIFDYLPIAQKDYSAAFEALGLKPEWFPLWASRMVEPSLDKKHAAVFVGTLDAKLNPERVSFFEKLQSACAIKCTSGDWATIFPFSEIVINQTVKGDLNFRVFESMICGAMLLTEKSANGLFDLFNEGEHLITYEKGNVQQAAELIQAYLAEPEKCRKIAEAGRREILSKHTEAHRAQRMLEILTNLTRNLSPLRHYAAMTNYVAIARLFYSMEASVAVRALSLALKCAEVGMKDGVPISPDLACYFVYACLRYDQLLHASIGEVLIRKMHQVNPEVGVLGLAAIRSYLNAGQYDEATAMASMYSEDPQGLFQQAEQLINSILSG